MPYRKVLFAEAVPGDTIITVPAQKNRKAAIGLPTATDHGSHRMEKHDAISKL
jgi:hypothetical protein